MREPANYKEAVLAIKTAILSSQYEAAKSVNEKQLMLYFGIGKYISLHSRNGFWGKGAIDAISKQLDKEMPGLKGFSARNLRYMRTFYEEWSFLEDQSDSKKNLEKADDAILAFADAKMENKIRNPLVPNLREFPIEAFFSIGFSHHRTILTKVKDVDEKVVENAIIHNIKNFILTFGKDFAFIRNQYHLDAFGEDQYIDLLFFNRQLNCLVAVELKKGKFKTSYLGQLQGYLSVLDGFEKKPHENPSIGLILCKDMNKSFVDYVIQDYTKPMGVATYKTSKDMSDELRNALPDIEALKQLLDSEEDMEDKEDGK